MSLISIIIPAYNRAHLIEETLNSITAQTYINWECIVIDDHSADDTLNVVSKIAKKDARIKVFLKPTGKPKGPSASRNYGFELCKGEFINWFDSDDIMKPNKLEKDLKAINSGNFDFSISQSDFFENGSRLIKGVWNKNIFSEDTINDFVQKKIGWGVNSPLWRKSSLLSAKLKFDERLITSDDYLYHIQALEKGLKPIVNDELLVSQRIHSDRLENYNVKSPFKGIVNLYLLSNAIKLELSSETLSLLNKRSLKILKSLYRNKKLSIGWKYSWGLLNIPNSNLSFIKLIKLYLTGLFYYITSKGYRYIE